jgi:hypothetical protein
MSIEVIFEAPDPNADELAPQQKRSREARERIIIAAEQFSGRTALRVFSMAAVGLRRPYARC